MRVYERDELLAMGELAVERDLVIVSDEIHQDLVYPGHRHLPIASLSPEIAVASSAASSALPRGSTTDMVPTAPPGKSLRSASPTTCDSLAAGSTR